MGCDGGTIPTRDELVKTKKKPEQVRNMLSRPSVCLDYVKLRLSSNLFGKSILRSYIGLAGIILELPGSSYASLFVCSAYC